MKWLKTWKWKSPSLTAIMIIFWLLPPVPFMAFQNVSPALAGENHSVSEENNSLRLLMGKITGIEEEKVNGKPTGAYRLYWEAEGQHTLELGSFEIYPKQFRAHYLKRENVKLEEFLNDHRGQWLFIYCIKCKQLFIAVQIKE